MKNDKLEPTSSENHAERALKCGPGCNCGGTRMGTKGKVIICLVVAIAAAIILANSVMQKAETGTGGGLNAFTLNVLAANKDTAGNSSDANWDKPLESLVSVRDLSAQKDAFFIYLPAKGQSPNETVRKEIEATAEKAQSQGTRTAVFVLDEGSEDYAQLTSQVPVPCVLAVSNGTGQIAVTTKISEANLLQSLVTASRPSGCAPGGCAVPC
jgi:hypothetical protein